MGIGRMLVLALLAVAASLTLRLDGVLAAVDLAAWLPGSETSAKAKPSKPAPSRASIAIEREKAPPAIDDIAELEAALLATTAKTPLQPTQTISSPNRASASAPSAPVPGIDPRMAQLTKMYAAMRPKDAARIFERLDLPVQVDIALAMRERTMAAILAEMRPETASDLMMALAGSPRRRAQAASAAE